MYLISLSPLDHLTCTGWLSQRCCLLSAPPPPAHRWQWYQPWPQGWWTSWWVLASSQTWQRYLFRSSPSHMLLLMLQKKKKKFISFICNINGIFLHSTVLYVWQLNTCLTFITGSAHQHPHRCWCWCCVKRKTALLTVIYKGLFVSLTITSKYSHSDAFWIKSAGFPQHETVVGRLP